MRYHCGMADSDRIRILFVCMGNICRSPLAEGIFTHKANERGVADRFSVDSAGTGGWHVGEPPDHRMSRTASAKGVKLLSRARQIRRDDARRFDYIICMDSDNRDDVLQLGFPPDRVSLLLEHDPAAPVNEVPDPYYGGQDGFEQVFALVDSACSALLDNLLSESARPAGPRQ
jgi:protein-tyrosine phosphatase